MEIWNRGDFLQYGPRKSVIYLFILPKILFETHSLQGQNNS
jgi:hypothetical protein